MKTIKENSRAIFMILCVIAYIIIIFMLPADNGWDYIPTDGRTQF